MTTTQPNDEMRNTIDIVEAAKLAGFNAKTLSYNGEDGGYSNQMEGYYDTKQAVEAIQRLIVDKQVEILKRVKGMGVYHVGEPEMLFVWEWKIEREINELQASLNTKQESN